MKKMTTARILMLAGGLVAFVSAMPAHAQFGGIVLDPTQSAHAVQQIYNEDKSLLNQAEDIAQGSQRNLTLIQQLTQDVQIAATALKTYQQSVTTYNTIFNNLKYFNSKQIWQSVENQLTLTNVANKYGETAGLQSQLNGTSQNASLVWKIMNLAISGTSSSFWGSEVVGNSQRLSTLARIEAADAAASQCLTATGAYQAARANNLSANTSLDTSIYDTSDLTNSEVEQLNLINMSNAQNAEEAHAQGQLHACMAAQAAVSNMDQRNQASLAINDASFKMTQQANNGTYLGNGSQTWTTYY
jgi:hypothetical protein